MISQETIEELLRSANAIKDETMDGANTARRVGTMFVEIINRLNNAGGGGAAVNYKRLDLWDDYDADKAGWVLSAALGVDLLNRIAKDAMFEKVLAGERDITEIQTNEEGEEVEVVVGKEPAYAVRLKPEFVGLYSEGWISAYGKSEGDGGTGGANVASQTWGDSTYTAQNAAPANLTYEKINDLLRKIEALEKKEYVTSWNDLKDKPTKEQLQTILGDYVSTFGGAKGAVTLLGGQTANGSVNLAMTGNQLGASVVGLKNLAFKESLTQDDIPTLAISKIDGLQVALDKKLDKAIFDDLFEKVTLEDGETVAIKAKYNLYSVGFVSAYDISNSQGGGSTLISDRLDVWDDYTLEKSTWVLSAKLGMELYTAINTTIAASLADFDERLRALAADPREMLTFKVTGSGNAVTEVQKVGTVVTLTKGLTFQDVISDLGTIRSNAANGNTAYSWGNHANAGYFKTSSFTKANIKTTLGISDWALDSTRPAYSKTDIGLGNVENTALSTWKGSTNITTLGTITSGTWHGSKIANSYLENSSMTINGTSVSLGGSFNTASITSGTAGTSSATSGYTLSVPYVSMNAYGIVTGYGTHTHTVNNIPNSSLQNSSMTIAGTSVSLGGSISASTIGKAMGTNKTAWGQTYWGSDGLPYSISGNLSEVGTLYFGTETSSTPRLWYDSTNKCLRTNVGIVSETFITAFGITSKNNDVIIGGNLRLQKAGTYYGTKLNFGDGEYVYLYEDTDDHLKMYASGGMWIGSNDNTIRIENATSSNTSSTGDTTPVISITSRLHIGTAHCGDQKYWRFYCDGTGYFADRISVNGSITVQGNVVHASDVTLKNIHDDVNLSIKDIADAPCFKYDYKNDINKNLYVGSSAQYWRKILTEAVTEDGQGSLSLDYTAVTFASVVALAKCSETHEERIKRLEDENRELKKRIVELENN